MADIENIKRQAQAEIEAIKKKAQQAVLMLQKQVADANGKASSLESELESTKKQLEFMRSEADSRNEQFQQKISELNEAVRSQEGKISDEREEKVASLKGELSRAQEEISRLNLVITNYAGNDQNQAESENLREALKKSEDKLALLKEQAKKVVESLRADLSLKQKEREEADNLANNLKRQLEEVLSRPSPTSEDSSMNDELAAKLDTVQAELQKANMLLEDAEQAKMAAMEQSKHMEEEVTRVKDKARQHIMKMQQELEEKTKEEREIRAQFEEELQKQAQMYESQMMTLREEGAAASSSSSNNESTIQAELQRAAQLVEEAEQAKNAVIEQSKKLEETLALVKDKARQHISKMQQELEEKSKEEERIRARYEEEMKRQAEAYEDQIKMLQQTQVHANNNESIEAEMQKATQLVQEAEQAKNAALEQAKKLEEDLARVKDKARRHIEKMQLDLDEKSKEEHRLRKQFEEEMKKQSESHEAQIKSLKEATNNSPARAVVVASASGGAPSDALLRMSKENKDLQAKLDSATKTLQAERDDFKAQNKSARDTIERLTKERTDLKREVDTAKEELRLVTKDLEKTKAELKKLQDMRMSTDPVEMQKRKEAEMQVFNDRLMKLESELRKEQAKNAELTKQRDNIDLEVAQITQSHLDKYNRLDQEMIEIREALAMADEENAELKRTAALSDQRIDEMKRKVRAQFQEMERELAETRQSLQKSREEEELLRMEVNTLKRQNDKFASSAVSAVESPAPSISPPPASSSSTFKILEEEKTKAENKRREAMDDLSKAKRDYGMAKKEAIQLAEAVDKLRTGLNKAALQAGGNLAMAADRCDDALRQCVMQIEAALAAVQARELAKSGAPSQSAGLAEEDGRTARHRQSSVDEPSTGGGPARREQEPEERLANALNDAERRLDEMTATLRAALPKVKQVATIAVQDKKTTNAFASLCSLSAVLAKLFKRERKGSDGDDVGYTGLQMQSRSGVLQRSRLGGRVLPETPVGEPDFVLDDEA